MTTPHETTPAEQLDAIRARLEQPAPTVLPNWTPPPPVPLHHLVMLDDLDLQSSLFMYFHRVDPYLQLQFGVQLLQMGLRAIQRAAARLDAPETVEPLVDMAAEAVEQLTALIASGEVRRAVRSAVAITSQCRHYYQEIFVGDEPVDDVIERELKPGNWQRMIVQSPYLRRFHHHRELLVISCLPPEPVLEAHMQLVVPVEERRLPVHDLLSLSTMQQVNQLILSGQRSDSRRHTAPTAIGAFVRIFSHTIFAARHLLNGVTLACGYRMRLGPSGNEERPEPALDTFWVGSRMHDVLDEMAFGLDSTVGSEEQVRAARRLIKAELFVAWMRRTPVLADPQQGQTTAGPEKPPTAPTPRTVSDVVPLTIESQTQNLPGGRVGERLTAYMVDEDGRRRKAGWMWVEQSQYLPGAWQVADMHVLPDWQMRGVATAMLLYALDVHGTLHPDWVGRIPQWGLRAWRRLLTSVTPSGATVRVCYPRFKSKRAPTMPDQPDVVYVEAKRGSWPEGCQPTTEPRAMVRADVPVELREFSLAIAKREEQPTVGAPTTPAVPLWPSEPTDKTGGPDVYGELRAYLHRPPAEAYDPLRDRPAPRNEPELDDQPTRMEAGREGVLSKWLSASGVVDEAIVISEMARWYARWLREHIPAIARVFRVRMTYEFENLRTVDIHRLNLDNQRPLHSPQSSTYMQEILDRSVDLLERYADGQTPVNDWRSREVGDAIDIVMIMGIEARDDNMPWTVPIAGATMGLYRAAAARALLDGAEPALRILADELLPGFELWLDERSNHDFMESEWLRRNFVRDVRRRMSVFSAGAGFE